MGNVLVWQNLHGWDRQDRVQTRTNYTEKLVSGLTNPDTRIVQYCRHDTSGQSELSSGHLHLIEGTYKFSGLSCWQGTRVIEPSRTSRTSGESACPPDWVNCPVDFCILSRLSIKKRAGAGMFLVLPTFFIISNYWMLSLHIITLTQGLVGVLRSNINKKKSQILIKHRHMNRWRFLFLMLYLSDNHNEDVANTL